MKPADMDLRPPPGSLVTLVERSDRSLPLFRHVTEEDESPVLSEAGPKFWSKEIGLVVAVGTHPWDGPLLVLVGTDRLGWLWSRFVRPA